MPLNLFGEEQPYIPEKDFSKESIYQRFKRINHYGLADHPDLSCKNCVNRRSFDYHGKYYHKCDLIGFSHSESTDIRLRNCCDKFEYYEDEHEINFIE